MEWYFVILNVIVIILILILFSAAFYRTFFKRFYDIILSGFALLALSPMLLALTVIGYFKMRGNPFFLQERPGKNERIFKLIKFRSMTNDKDENGKLLPDDKRLGKYGNFLRKFSLDELAELINIFKGDMSIVGPRPLLVRYLPYYTEKERVRHDVRPGLSGLAQVEGRNFITWDETFQYDIEYVEKYNLWLDISIIVKTVLKVITRDGVSDATDGTIDSSGRIVHDSLDIERGAKK